MPDNVKRAGAIATIDCTLIAIKPQGEADTYILDTASNIQVEPVIETQEAITLIIKNILRAQKKAAQTITGNTITLTDNVFTPEVVLILQGGKVEYGEMESTKVTKYTPPAAGSGETGKVFDLMAYSAIYDAAGLILGYEKITYPNCTGQPVAFSSEDGVFRVNNYTIDSAPKQGQAPYTIEYVDSLPVESEAV